MEDPVKQLIERAFAAVVEAEKLIYAAGIKELKPDIIEAHSVLLRLKNSTKDRA